MNRPAGRARRARGRLSGALAAVAAAIVALSPGDPRAEDVLRLAALGSAGPETLVVQIALNTQKKGQYFACAIDGELYLRVRDLPAIGLVDARGQTRLVDGDEYVRLESVRGLRVRFDERRLALDLTADPGLLPAHTIDFWPAPKEEVLYPTNRSAFLNYDFTHAGGNDGLSDATAITAELGVRIGDFLFDGDGYCRTGGSTGRRCVRLTTSVVHDDRSTLVRTVAGDFPAGSGALGGTVNMGGLSYSKLYNMDPYFLRFPQQAIAGQLRTPSEVDVYIDGQRVRQLTLPAGDFDLRNITQSVGYRAVDVVIRDAFGREQRISTSYYVTEALLKAGLHEYSYNVGALRENFGVESNDYGPLAFAGYHRYGVTDALTIGARAEGRSGQFNGGPSATFSLGNAGIVTVAGAVSDDHGQTGAAGLVTYSYLGPHVNAALFARKDSRHFVAPLAPTDVARNYDVGGTIGYTAPGFGTVSVGLAVFRPYSGQDRTAVSGGYARTLFAGRASFFVTVVNERAGQRTTSVFAGLVWNFDADYSLAANYQRFRGASTESVQFQKALPVGEGLGYTIGAQRSSGDGTDTTTANPSFQYNGRWGVLRGYATQQNGPEGTRRGYSVSASGALAWAGDGFALGRPITDGFGIVRVDAAEGVPVRVNGQEIGRTGADGTLFVPTLASFLQNQVSIDAANVPLDLSFPDAMRLVSPAYRAGAIVDFHAKRLSAFTGTLRIRLDGEVRPAEFYQATLAVAGRPVTFRTGRGGEFYLEDLKPGRYAARLAANGHACNFELVVPDASGPITELPPIVCDADR